MTSTSKFRIPKAKVAGLHGALVRIVAKKMFRGELPDAAVVMLHHPAVLRASSAMGAKMRTWKKVPADLKTYATMASAGTIGCSWCLDFGYYMAHNEGLDLSKVREVPRWRESDVFTPLEREVLAYAEAMSSTPLTVTDEMVASLVRQLGAAGAVELTQVIAFENMVSRFNSAAGLSSQGFSDVCELPLAQPSASAQPTASAQRP